MFAKNFKSFLNCNNFFLHTFLLKKSILVINIIFVIIGILLMWVGAPVINNLISGDEDSINASIANNFVNFGVIILIINSIITSILLSLHIFKDNYSNGIELLLNSKPISRHVIIISKISFVICTFLIHSLIQLLICCIAYAINSSYVSADYVIGVSFGTFVLSSLFFGFFTAFVGIWASAKGARAFVFIFLPLILIANLLTSILPLMVFPLNQIGVVLNKVAEKTTNELKQDKKFMDDMNEYINYYYYEHEAFKSISLSYDLSWLTVPYNNIENDLNKFENLINENSSLIPNEYYTYFKKIIDTFKNELNKLKNTFILQIDYQNMEYTINERFHIDINNELDSVVRQKIKKNLQLEFSNTMPASGLMAVNYVLTPFLLKTNAQSSYTSSAFFCVNYTNSYQFIDKSSITSQGDSDYSQEVQFFVYKENDRAPNYGLALITLFYVLCFAGLNYFFYLRKDFY